MHGQWLNSHSRFSRLQFLQKTILHKLFVVQICFYSRSKISINVIFFNTKYRISCRKVACLMAEFSFGIFQITVSATNYSTPIIRCGDKFLFLVENFPKGHFLQYELSSIMQEISIAKQYSISGCIIFAVNFPLSFKDVTWLTSAILSRDFLDGSFGWCRDAVPVAATSVRAPAHRHRFQPPPQHINILILPSLAAEKDLVYLRFKKIIIFFSLVSNQLNAGLISFQRKE